MEAKKLELNTLKSLHMLVDSHFMYNVLNSLQGGVLVEGVEENFQRFQLFSSFYKGMNQGVASWRSADKEWSFIENYMKLEKERFIGETEYQVPVVDTSGWNAVYLPTFVLQPFLENEWQKKRNVQEGFAPRVSIKDEFLEIVIKFRTRPEQAVHTKLENKCVLFKERINLLNEEDELASWQWSSPHSSFAHLKLKLMESL
jgi:LytS/YehU family sensor histidine kinase